MGNQGMIKRLLRGLLPAALYGVGQEGVRRYRRQRQAAAPKLDEGACCRLLGEEMGLGPGAIVFVHSSVDRLHLDFPFFKLLGIGYWFHAYLIGEYWGGRKYYHSHLGGYRIEKSHLSL